MCVFECCSSSIEISKRLFILNLRFSSSIASSWIVSSMTLNRYASNVVVGVLI